MVEPKPRRINVDEVEQLRMIWREALHAANVAKIEARQNLTDSKRLAYADERGFNAQLNQAAYEDAARRFEKQEDRDRDAASDRLASTNTKLAQSQTLIAGAVAFFTLVQVFLAVAQAMKWIKP